MIEQSIFTAQSGAPERGYHVVATSANLLPDDARELVNWGPIGGSLSGSSVDGASVNFHPLPSGAMCVSRSVVFGTPDSAIFGPRLYTQSLIVPPDDLERHANNPFCLLRAVRAKGMLKVLEPAAPPLASFEVGGRSPRVDEGLLAQFIELLGARRVAWLIHSALSADSLVLVNSPGPEFIVSGILNCLPVECRPELPFTTGLKHSPRRPFRLHVTTAESALLSRLYKHSAVTILNVTAEPPSDFRPTGWAGYLLAAAERDVLSTVCTELERPRPGLRLSDLNWLGEQLHDSLRWSPLGSNRISELDFDEPADFAAAGDSYDRGQQIRHAEAAHRLAGPAVQGPSLMATIDDEAPCASDEINYEVLDQLGQLDDLVFDTLSGKTAAAEQLAQLWSEIAPQLSDPLLAESREQYLRYALKQWDPGLMASNRDPRSAVTTLEVLSLLFREP